MFGLFNRKITVNVVCECKSKESTLQKISAISQSLTFIVALVTVFVAYCQIKASSQQAQQELASSMYQSYLKLAFDYPQFAEPEDLWLYCSENRKNRKCVRYEWFAARVLYTAENILALELSDGDMEGWKNQVDRLVGNHSRYIRSNAFKEHSVSYSCQMREILYEKGASEKCSN
ncbi:hypothetical protein ACKGLS_004751 [Vibrio alginolyticus]|uniref:hypothetical protein n=1 Tax=Vibrio alginolyticus TaxID=663 RepID=UPI003C12DAB5